MLSKFNSRKPRYNDDSDYNTNAPSYYDDLARKSKLIELLAKKIYDYNETLTISLKEIKDELDHYVEIVDDKISLIDHKIGEGFNQEINTLLVDWLADGTLDHIINETIFSWKVDKTEFDDSMNSVNQQLAETVDYINNITLNVKRFGAKGDGATDDTDAINLAVDKLHELGGGKLLFPKGEYIVDFVIMIRDIPCIIEGNGATIKLKDQSKLFHNPTRNDSDINSFDLDNLFRDYHSIFLFVDCDYVLFKGMDIDGNGENQSEQVIGETWYYLDPGVNNEVSVYKYYAGVKILYTKIGIEPMVRIMDNRIYNCSWSNLELGNRNRHTIKGDFLIENNYFGSSSHDSVSIHRSKNVRVIGNEFKNPNTHSLHVYINVENIFIEANTFELDSQIFVFTPQQQTSLKTFIQVGHESYDKNIIKNVFITNNFISSKTTSYGSTQGITIAKTIINLTITNNKIYDIVTCFLLMYPVLDKVIIDSNKAFYNHSGLSLRPATASGNLRELSSDIPKPYKVEIRVVNNIFIANQGAEGEGLSLVSFGFNDSSLLSNYTLVEQNNIVSKRRYVAVGVFNVVRDIVEITKQYDELYIPPNSSKTYKVSSSVFELDHYLLVKPMVDLPDDISASVSPISNGFANLVITNTSDDDIFVPAGDWVFMAIKSLIYGVN